ncbi:hypothetical protein AB0N09_35845 [Streptomyces erythrochromogenes]|uniref:hypothetical protein n=1 Tax=Streptomyces erythrochromogenes TaxID=285574 RepID=UPI0034409D9A
MARNIGAGPSGDYFRTAVTARYTDSAELEADLQRYRQTNKVARDFMTLTWFEGPYGSPGRAWARVTIWEKEYAGRKSGATVTCEPQSCKPDWKALPPRQKRTNLHG